MKKTFFILLPLLLLASCFSSDEESVSSGLVEVETEAFTLSVPESWSEVSPSSISSPKIGTLELAYASETQREGYINNLVVLAMDATQGESSVALMENTKIGLKTNLSLFSLISEQAITFADGDTGTALIYKGKYSKSTPTLTYIQTAKQCDDTSYFTTLSFSQDIEDYSRYVYLLGSFDCQ